MTFEARERSPSLVMSGGRKYYSVAYFRTANDGSVEGFRHMANDGTTFTPDDFSNMTLAGDEWYASVGVIHPPDAVSGEARAMPGPSEGKIYRLTDTSEVKANRDISLLPPLSTPILPVAQAAESAPSVIIDLGAVKNVYRFEIAPQYTSTATTTSDYATALTLEASRDGTVYDSPVALAGFAGPGPIAVSSRKIVELPVHVSARYLRLTATESPGTARVRVGEFVTTDVVTFHPITDSPSPKTVVTETISVPHGSSTEDSTSTAYFDAFFTDWTDYQRNFKLNRYEMVQFGVNK